MKISNYATSKVEEMRRNNDAIETNREEKQDQLNELDEEVLRDRKEKKKGKYKTSPGRMISSIGYRGEE